jgi:hypothetical protein
VPVQRLLQALLVQRVANQSDAARQHKQAVQVANADDVIHLLLAEAAAAVQQVQEQRADAAVNVEHQVCSLLQRVLLNCDGVVKVLGAREELQAVKTHSEAHVSMHTATEVTLGAREELHAATQGKQAREHACMQPWLCGHLQHVILGRDGAV